MTRTLPPLCFVREVLDPGVLIVKRRRIRDSGKFVNVALLEGDQIKILDHNTWILPDSWRWVSAAVTLTPGHWANNLINELGVSGYSRFRTLHQPSRHEVSRVGSTELTNDVGPGSDALDDTTVR